MRGQTSMQPLDAYNQQPLSKAVRARSWCDRFIQPLLHCARSRARSTGRSVAPPAPAQGDQMLRILLALLLVLVTTPVWSAEPPRTVEVTAPDGAALKATYYAAAGPGPAVLLLHMCNATRQSWDPVGRGLSAAGIHALALDYRGYGDSAGDRHDKLPVARRQALVTGTWPGDVDAALAYLQSQPGVDKSRAGAGGGSCGVQQAVYLARRQPTVRSLVLLAGGTDRAG